MNAALSSRAIVVAGVVSCVVACGPPSSSDGGSSTVRQVPSDTFGTGIADLPQVHSLNDRLGAGDVVAGEGEGAVGEGEGEGAIGEGEGEGAPVITVTTDAPVFVAVGYGGRRLSTVDGSTWLNDAADAAGGGDDDNLLRDVCFGRDASGRGVFVAVGGSSIGRIMRTTDGGASWSTVVDDNDGWLGGVAYGVVNGQGIFVAAGSHRAIRSVDGGVTWIDPTDHFTWQMRDVAFAHGTFVAVGDAGVFSSVDGVSWTAQQAPSVSHIAAGPAGFVAVGAGVRIRSVDGASWQVDSDSAARDVAYDGARFVVAGASVVKLSADGLTWESHSSAPFIDVVAAGNGHYLGSSWPNARVASEDGVTWRNVADDGGNAIAAIAFGAVTTVSVP